MFFIRSLIRQNKFNDKCLYYDTLNKKTLYFDDYDISESFYDSFEEMNEDSCKLDNKSYFVKL